jgi:putative aminopeptidase FrvX
MIKAVSLKFFEELLNCSGPSGYEELTAAVYRKYLEPFCDEVRADVMGNTIGVLNPDAEFRVMLSGHYDEIGFQVSYVSDEGLLYFRANGGIDKLNIPGLEVEVITENGMVHGVIGKKPIHLLKPKERDKALELTDMWIDIGVEDKEEALKLVSVGDPVAVLPNYRRMGKHRVMSKGMDDKVGAFIVAEVLKNLSKRKINVGVYGVGSVQEELGLRGATTGAFAVNPQVGFGIDVGFSSDLPDISKKICGEIKLGDGPMLSRTADNNIILHRTLCNVAKKNKVKWQDAPGYRASGGTDTAAIQLTRGGVATALISIPNRYMHSPVEMCDLRDIESAIKLLTETIASFKGDESFLPGID